MKALEPRRRLVADSFGGPVEISRFLTELIRETNGLSLEGTLDLAHQWSVKVELVPDGAGIGGMS